MKQLVALLMLLTAAWPVAAQNFGNIPPQSVIGNPSPTAKRPAGPRAFDFVSPMDFGAAGDGTGDDTNALQLAVNAAANSTLVLGPHLYAINGSVTAASPVQIIGGYSGGGYEGWSSPFGTCAVGIKSTGLNANVLVLHGSGSSIRNVCFDARGLSNTSGAAVIITNGVPGAPLYLSNVIVEGNQFNGFCSSVEATAIPGGSQIVETYIVRNMFQPVNNAGCRSISIGRTSNGGGTTDTHIMHNVILCHMDNVGNQSDSLADGMYFQDSGGSFVIGNDIVSCLHGTVLNPGANQLVNGFHFNDTVLGDTSKNNALLVDTQDPSGYVGNGKIVGSWLASSTGPDILVQNTGGGKISGVHFIGDTDYPRQGFSSVVLNAGDDITFTGGSACPQDVSHVSLFDITTPGSVGIHDMTIGACDSPNTGYQVDAGVYYHPSAAGKISITGNQFYTSVTTPIRYKPDVPPASVVIASNAGVDDLAVDDVVSAPTMTFPVFPTFSISGTAAIKTINGGWPGRCVNIIPGGGWTTVTGGNINPARSASIGVLMRACYTGVTWYFE